MSFIQDSLQNRSAVFMGSNSDWPPRFGVDESNVLELFTGDRFYSSSDAALREAILNSIDACGRRKALEGDSYDRSIEVVFDRDALTITVRDNGDGMNKDQVSNLFTEVGATAADLAVQMEAENYQAVGEFGIGVVSYFLVCEEYELHTVGDSGDPVGIRLSNKMLDAKTDAEEISPRREQRGTTLVFPISDAEVFDRLLNRFPHWVRDVEYLEARRMSTGDQVEQGGLTSDIRPVQPEELPEWIEKIHLGPPTDFDRWYHLDGNGDVDLLYRGVFVDNIKPRNLWGLEGAIHVDPKEFESKLNREGFIGDKDEETIVRFLRRIHPLALKKSLNCVREIDFSSRKKWGKLRWVNLWLAIPRSNNYKEVYKVWDEEFRNLKVFELLLPNNSSRSVSVADIDKLDVNKIYLVPSNLNQIDDLGRQSVRVLRARGVPVVQSTERESFFFDESIICREFVERYFEIFH